MKHVAKGDCFYETFKTNETGLRSWRSQVESSKSYKQNTEESEDHEKWKQFYTMKYISISKRVDRKTESWQISTILSEEIVM